MAAIQTPKMEQIKKEYNLSETEFNQIVTWFTRRFHRAPEQDFGYFADWVYRIQCNKFYLMDSQSKKLWNEITGAHLVIESEAINNECKEQSKIAPMCIGCTQTGAPCTNAQAEAYCMRLNRAPTQQELSGVMSEEQTQKAIKANKTVYKCSLNCKTCSSFSHKTGSCGVLVPLITFIETPENWIAYLKWVYGYVEQ